MNFKVELTPNFKREAKKLIKKYPSLKEEIGLLAKALKLHPTIGTPLGNDVYKIRIGIKSKGKGKSGGARVISFIKLTEEKTILLTIYDKNEKDTIYLSEIKSILKRYL